MTLFRWTGVPLVLATTATLIGLTAAPVRADLNWIAISADPAEPSSGAWGEGATEAEAIGAATAKCHSYGGGFCLAQAVRQPCYAGVIGPDQRSLFYGAGNSWLEAEDAAHRAAGTPGSLTASARCQGGGTGGEPPTASSATVVSSVDVYDKPSHEGGRPIVVDGANLFLQDREVDLDLVEPGGVDR